MKRIPEGKIVFLSTEFLYLSKDAEPISIALCTEEGKSLSTELHFDAEKASDWVKAYVIPNLKMVSRFSKEQARTRLLDWLNYVRENQRVVIVSDCVINYDWILFCDLLDNQLPGFIYYTPLDLSTMLWMRGIAPDISREEFFGLDPRGENHTAAWNAQVIGACFKKLMELEDAPAYLIDSPLDDSPVIVPKAVETPTSHTGSLRKPEEEQECLLKSFLYEEICAKVVVALEDNEFLQPKETDTFIDAAARKAVVQISEHLGFLAAHRVIERLGDLALTKEQ